MGTPTCACGGCVIRRRGSRDAMGMPWAEVGWGPNRQTSRPHGIFTRAAAPCTSILTCASLRRRVAMQCHGVVSGDGQSPLSGASWRWHLPMRIHKHSSSTWWHPACVSEVRAGRGERNRDRHGHGHGICRPRPTTPHPQTSSPASPLAWVGRLVSCSPLTVTASP